MSTDKQPLFARDPDASFAVAIALIMGAVTVVAVLSPWINFFT